VTNDWVLCQTCYCMLSADPRAQAFHQQWHQDTADVVIENTKRIRELEAGYRDQ
jgi:hypothetical protein